MVKQENQGMEGQGSAPFSAVFRERKRHINFYHINSVCRPSSPECPRDKLGLSQGQTRLPLCKIRRKPGFVPGTNPLCPGDKPGLSQGHSRGVPRATGPKVYVYVPFSCLSFFGCFQCRAFGTSVDGRRDCNARSETLG